jgi:hypothetical protein
MQSRFWILSSGCSRKRAKWIVILAFVSLAGLILWQKSSGGHLEVIPHKDAQPMPLTVEDLDASILPSGIQMTKERVVTIRGNIVGDEGVKLRSLYSDSSCRVTLGSELTIGRGHRIGFSRKSDVEIGLAIHKSFTAAGIYADFLLSPAGGRLIGVGRPLVVGDIDMRHRWTARLSLPADLEVVIFAASTSPISLAPLSTVDDVLDNLPCPYFVILAKRLGRIKRDGDHF